MENYRFYDFLPLDQSNLFQKVTLQKALEIDF